MSYISNTFDDRVASLLNDGGVGLLPTDTIYGLSAQAFNENAVKKIHKIKDRSSHKPFIILISQESHLDDLGIDASSAELIKNYWPGSLSAILPTNNSLNWLDLDTKTLAIRWPDYPELQKLIDQTGPIISTSANIQGGEPIHSVTEAKKLFKEQLDFYVDTGSLNNPPSTLVIEEKGRLKVIRQGAVKIK